MGNYAAQTHPASTPRLCVAGPYPPHLMDARVAREIFWQHGAGDVFHVQVQQGGVVEFEASVVGGKQQCAAGREQRHGLTDEGHVIALHVEAAFHALGIGKGRRVEQDQPVALPMRRCALRRQPLHAIGLYVTMLSAGVAVERHVAARPFHIGMRHVHAGGARCAARGGVDAGAGGVSK